MKNSKYKVNRADFSITYEKIKKLMKMQCKHISIQK